MRAASFQRRSKNSLNRCGPQPEPRWYDVCLNQTATRIATFVNITLIKNNNGGDRTAYDDRRSRNLKPETYASYSATFRLRR